jgi:DNA-binding beta-propeller fold protein YncE
MTGSAFGVNFAHPKDITVVGNTVYVADTTNRRIVKLDATTGAPIGSPLGGAVLHSVEGVAVEPSTGNIWASDTNYNRLVQLSGDGTLLQTFGSLGSGSSPAHGTFNWPTHLEILELPNQPMSLFVADSWNDRIEVFTLNN